LLSQALPLVELAGVENHPCDALELIHRATSDRPSEERHTSYPTIAGEIALTDRTELSIGTASVRNQLSSLGSEIAGLRVGRVDFLRSNLAVVETRAEVEGRLMFADVKSPASRRTLALPPFLVELLAAHLAARGRPGPE
jgi:hypothetical protein